MIAVQLRCVAQNLYKGVLHGVQSSLFIHQQMSAAPQDHGSVASVSLFHINGQESSSFLVGWELNTNEARKCHRVLNKVQAGLLARPHARYVMALAR